MNQSERRQILIRSLLKERPEYQKIEIPHNGNEQKKLLRSLMNIRMAAPVSEEFQRIQDEYLQEENRTEGLWNFRLLRRFKMKSTCGGATLQGLPAVPL